MSLSLAAAREQQWYMLKKTQSADKDVRMLHG